MKTYNCKLCPFTTGSRKRIRDHVRNVHHVKGAGKGEQKKSSDSVISDITRSYEAVER